jgi:hypothetical protein
MITLSCGATALSSFDCKSLNQFKVKGFSRRFDIAGELEVEAW